MRFTMRIDEAHALDWVAAAADIRAMALSLGYLFTAALRQAERISGADRWSFQRSGEVVSASIHGERRELDCFTVGQRHQGRDAFSCAACEAKLQPRAEAYRPASTKSLGRVAWDNIRFCASCVEEARAVGAPALRVIDGGLAKKRGAAS